MQISFSPRKRFSWRTTGKIKHWQIKLRANQLFVMNNSCSEQFKVWKWSLWAGGGSCSEKEWRCRPVCQEATAQPPSSLWQVCLIILFHWAFNTCRVAELLIRANRNPPCCKGYRMTNTSLLVPEQLCEIHRAINPNHRHCQFHQYGHLYCFAFQITPHCIPELHLTTKDAQVLLKHLFYQASLSQG